MVDPLQKVSFNHVEILYLRSCRFGQRGISKRTEDGVLAVDELAVWLQNSVIS